MAAALRLLAGGLATVLAFALTTAPAHATTRRTPTAKPTPAPQVRKAPTILPPQIYQLNPLKVNPTVQPNIMIFGQGMTPATTAQVGGWPARRASPDGRKPVSTLCGRPPTSVPPGPAPPSREIPAPRPAPPGEPLASLPAHPASVPRFAWHH